jgi:hypothetical protein
MTRAGAATDAAPASSDRGLCAHEATHATAAWLLGRELGEVIVDGDRSHADVATLRADVGPGDVGLEVVVDDLVVLLSGTRSPAARSLDPDRVSATSGTPATSPPGSRRIRMRRTRLSSSDERRRARS